MSAERVPGHKGPRVPTMVSKLLLSYTAAPVVQVCSACEPAVYMLHKRDIRLRFQNSSF